MKYLPIFGLLAMLPVEIVLHRLSAWRSRRREWQSVQDHSRFVRDLRPTPIDRPYRPGPAR